MLAAKCAAEKVRRGFKTDQIMPGILISLEEEGGYIGVRIDVLYKRF